ncbi:MAG: hypothetical protein AAGE52_38485 [Myxococcota bacterium]
MSDALDYQLARFREMTPAERWKAAHQLYWSARRLKAAFFREMHPEWTEEQVEDAVREAFRRARD